MTQSERLLQGVQWTDFEVDYDGYRRYYENLLTQFDQAKTELAKYGLVKYNSSQEVKAWLESFGFDCSRGAGKEVYQHPTNVAARPAEMKALSEVKRLEALRRKFVSTEKLLVG